MATYYVMTTGNDTTGDGSSGNPWATPGKGAASMGTGDILYVKSGTYTMTTATAGAGGPILFPNGVQAQIEGYESTIGDACPTNNRPILAAATYAPTYMVQFRPAFENPQHFAHFKIDGNSQAVVGISATGSANTRYVTAYNCEVIDCDGTNGGIYYANSVACFVSSCAQVGCNNGVFVACHSKNNGSHGFRVDDQGSYCVDCIAYDNTGDGFYTGSYSAFINCTAWSNTGNGFTHDYIGLLVNCVAVANGGFGVNAVSAGRPDAHVFNLATQGNSSGAVDAVFKNYNAVALSGDPFLDSASFDFRPDSTSGEGAALRAAGIGPIGQTNNKDIGAVQHTDPAGGGSALPGNLLGGMFQ